MATLSPKERCIKLLLESSGTGRLLPNMVVTYPFFLASSTSPSKNVLIFGYVSKYRSIYSAASFLLILKSWLNPNELIP